MTTTEPIEDEATKAAQLIETLRGHILDFERSQANVKRRFREIRTGTLNPQRTPTADLIEQRSQKRADFRAFLDGISREEKNIMTIADGSSWRAKYDDLLDPARDPKFE